MDWRAEAFARTGRPASGGARGAARDAGLPRLAAGGVGGRGRGGCLRGRGRPGGAGARAGGGSGGRAAALAAVARAFAGGPRRSLRCAAGGGGGRAGGGGAPRGGAGAAAVLAARDARAAAARGGGAARAAGAAGRAGGGVGAGRRCRRGRCRRGRCRRPRSRRSPPPWSRSTDRGSGAAERATSRSGEWSSGRRRRRCTFRHHAARKVQPSPRGPRAAPARPSPGPGSPAPPTALHVSTPCGTEGAAIAARGPGVTARASNSFHERHTTSRRATPAPARSRHGSRAARSDTIGHGRCRARA